MRAKSSRISQRPRHDVTITWDTGLPEMPDILHKPVFVEAVTKGHRRSHVKIGYVVKAQGRRYTIRLFGFKEIGAPVTLRADGSLLVAGVR